MNAFDSWQSHYDNLSPCDFETIDRSDNKYEDAQEALATLMDELFADHTECDEETIKESLLYIAQALNVKIENIQNKKLSIAPLKVLNKLKNIQECKEVLDKQFIKRNVKTLSHQIYGREKLDTFHVESSIKNLLWHCNDREGLPSKRITVQRVGV